MKLSTIKKLTILLVIATLFTGCSKEKFDHQGFTRKYILHLPKDLPDNAPLVFALHGYTNKAGFIKFYTRMNKVANDNGFAVVYPQGLKDDTEGEETHWNADLELSDIDDISFITSLADELQTAHNLNPDRTFAFGISNGGFMAYTLACKSPDKFAAVASIIGTMSGKTWDERNITSAAVPVLQISGLEDNVVPADGSMSTENGWGGAPAADSVAAYWAARNNCTNVEQFEASEHATSHLLYRRHKW